MNTYEINYWENVVCDMVYNKADPTKSEFNLKTNCGTTPLYMYRVGTYADTGKGLETCSGWELNKEFTKFNLGRPKVKGKKRPFATCSFRRPLEVDETATNIQSIHTKENHSEE